MSSVIRLTLAAGQDPASAAAPGHAPPADALNPSLDSAFWIWNLVSNMAYGDRADIVSRALKAGWCELKPVLRALDYSALN